MHAPTAEGRPPGGGRAFTSGLVVALLVAGCAGAVAATPAMSPAPGATWTVSEVIDGDTIRVANAGVEEVVRLVGINTPEHDECWSDEATAALAEVLGTGPVRMERDVSDRDQYGRLLRYVMTPEE